MSYLLSIYKLAVEKNKLNIMAQDNKSYIEGHAQNSGNVNSGVLINA